ncbi:MAG: glycosyl transferase [Blastocatellia bacterium]|nr:MAG: glycosyl transferase [Blastocatellia bacterium]
MLDQITPLILTYNEAPNLERTMRQVSWATDIVVVDSFSSDETAVIAKSFEQARFFQRKFDNHQNQWTFGLTQTSIKTPWVLALDADYVLTDELIDELKNLEPESSLNGYTVQFIYCLNGKPLRSGIYPPVNVLYLAAEAIYELDGHTQRVKINGPVGQLNSKVLHDDRKSLRRWFHSQVTYAELEARKLLTANSKLSVADRVRTWRLFAPVAVVLYCLVWRGGLLDGWRGLFYAFQRGIAELMLSLYLIAAKLSGKYKAQLRSEAATRETLPAKN